MGVAMDDDIPKGSKLYQIYEHDLALLERCLPILHDAVSPEALQWPRVQVALEECKRIASDIRWNYGPDQERIIVKP